LQFSTELFNLMGNTWLLFDYFNEVEIKNWVRSLIRLIQQLNFTLKSNNFKMSVTLWKWKKTVINVKQIKSFSWFTFREKTPFKVFIMMPLLPAFEGQVCKFNNVNFLSYLLFQFLLKNTIVRLFFRFFWTFLNFWFYT